MADSRPLEGLRKIEVKVGQIWADNDKRSEGRMICVIAVGERFALVEAYAPGHRGRARQTQIRLDRFRPTATGYRLVSEEADRG